MRLTAHPGLACVCSAVVIDFSTFIYLFLYRFCLRLCHTWGYIGSYVVWYGREVGMTVGLCDEGSYNAQTYPGSVSGGVYFFRYTPQYALSADTSILSLLHIISFW